MLPPFIIEQIRRREEEQAQKYEQPQLEVPLLPIPHPSQKRREESEEGQRGVIILEL